MSRGPYARRQKYGAQPTTIDNIRFDSKVEARRYQELRLLEKAGEIQGLECHPRFVLRASAPDYGQVGVGEYVADFRYYIGLREVVEDVKGMRTPLYRLKKKIAEACHRITITEIGVKPSRTRRQAAGKAQTATTQGVR